jgi:hypothetical protein
MYVRTGETSVKSDKIRINEKNYPGEVHIIGLN